MPSLDKNCPAMSSSSPSTTPPPWPKPALCMCAATKEPVGLSTTIA